MHRTRNAAYGQPYRGFESLPLRHALKIQRRLSFPRLRRQAGIWLGLSGRIRHCISGEGRGRITRTHRSRQKGPDRHPAKIKVSPRRRFCLSRGANDNVAEKGMRVMEKTTLASFRFPRRLTETPKNEYAPQELVDFLKTDPSYFHQSFRRKFKPRPAAAEEGDIVTGEPLRAHTLDVVSKTRSAQGLLEAMAAIADFHKLVVRENVDHWEAIEPDFVRWRDFPGAYVLWTARIVRSPAGAGGDDQPARLRVVRQLVASEKALDAVAGALELFPQVRIDGDDMIVSYIAGKTRRPALADGQ